MNPFEVVREYQRALNATKLERVFAKPFVGSLDGHTDGQGYKSIYCWAIYCAINIASNNNKQ